MGFCLYAQAWRSDAAPRTRPMDGLSFHMACTLPSHPRVFLVRQAFRRRERPSALHGSRHAVVDVLFFAHHDEMSKTTAPGNAGEARSLDAIAANSDYGSGLEQASTAYCYEIFSRHLVGPEILELGPADGVMTRHLSQSGHEITAVDGASAFCEALRRRHPGITVVHSLFEHFEPDRRFDTIILGHVLEHVADPGSTLRNVAGWLAPGGRVLVAVPNADSLHRQAAVLMGLLPGRDAPSEADRRHGHRRVYSPGTLKADLIGAGLSIERFGGYWLKPLANLQMEASWTPDLIAAFMRLGEDHPDIAGVLYAVATAGRDAGGLDAGA